MPRNEGPAYPGLFIALQKVLLSRGFLVTKGQTHFKELRTGVWKGTAIVPASNPAGMHTRYIWRTVSGWKTGEEDPGEIRGVPYNYDPRGRWHYDAF